MKRARHGLEDRAFRALARAHTECVLALLRVCAPGLVPSEDDTRLVALDDPNLDVPPHPREADLVARVESSATPTTTSTERVLHGECQGYRDPSFLDRVVDYHLMLSVRHPKRHVSSFAIWMRNPAPQQRIRTFRRGDIRVDVHTIVLAEVPAEHLLAVPAAACFAAGADPGSMSVDELCERVARALIDADASQQQRVMAVVAAASRGRYDAMRSAMERHQMEAVTIEDLVDYGFEQGIERGLAQGEVIGARQMLLDLLDARGVTPNAAQRDCIGREVVLENVRTWFRRALTASSIEEVIR